MKKLNVNYPACPALCGVYNDDAKAPIIVLPTCKRDNGNPGIADHLETDYQ